MYEQKQERLHYNTIIDESLLGLIKIHNGLLLLQGHRAILRRDYANLTAKVKLICGSKADNELLNAGYIGPGMLTAAIFGNTSSAPSVHNILTAIEEIDFDHSSGVLLIVQNDVEQILNFTLAKMQAEARGHIVKTLIINNNTISSKTDCTNNEESILPILYVYKIAGAMSEEGKSIDEIYDICNTVGNNEIILYKTDLGNLIATEYILERFAKSATEFVESIAHRWKKSFGNEKENSIHGHEVAILINCFGYKQIVANVFMMNILKEIEQSGLTIKRIYLKYFIAELNNNRFDICLLNLSCHTPLIQYLDCLTSAFGWPKMFTSEATELGEYLRNDRTIPRMHSMDEDWYHIPLIGPTMNYEISQIFLSIVSTACEGVIACTKQLNKMDEKFGDGNYGTNLACGAKAIQDAIQQNKIKGTHPYTAFSQFSYIIQETMTGIPGGLYSLYLYNIAKAFSEYQNDKDITLDLWFNVLRLANHMMKQFEEFTTTDRKLIESLVKIEGSLECALKRNMDPLNAFGAAVQAAESFTTSVLYGPSKLQYPEPQAHSVGVWMRAAYEGTKLRLKNCMTI